MNTNRNIHNYAEMLTISNIEHIAEQDFTLDELMDFASFVNMMSKAYARDCNREAYSMLEYKAKRYQETVDILTFDEVADKENDWLDDAFFDLKIAVEDMAYELIWQSPHFFSDARR